MSDHLSSLLLEQYRKGLMPASELLAADDHLASCAGCRARAWDGEAIRNTFDSLGMDLCAPDSEASEHLSYERIVALIRRELDEVERATVESHLTFCGDCAGDVRDLSAFAAQADARRAPSPEPSPPTTFMERLAAFWLTLQSRPALSFGLTAVVLASAGAGLWWSSVTPDPRPRNDIAQTLPPAPAATQATQPDATRSTASAPPESHGGDSSPQPAPATTPLSGDPGTPRPAASPQPPNVPPPAAAGVVAALDDRHGRVTLDRSGRIEGLPTLPPDLRRATASALQTRRVQTPAAVRELGGPAGTLLGRTDTGDSFAVSSPVGTAVSTARPTFHWQPLGGASSYTVTVLDADFNVVAVSPSLTATTWAVPQPLRRGGVYRWQVSALKGGAEVIAPAPTAPEARFKVLDESSLKELAHAEQICRESHLACGVLYSRVGLLDEAEREFKSLADANPHSTLARALLQAVRKSRRPR